MCESSGSRIKSCVSEVMEGAEVEEVVEVSCSPAIPEESRSGRRRHRTWESGSSSRRESRRGSMVRDQQEVRERRREEEERRMDESEGLCDGLLIR